MDGKQHGARRVPAITVHFWVVKILTTAMGEAASDYLVHTINPYAAVAIGGLGITVALVGRGTVAIALSFVIIAWVAYLSVSKVDVEDGVTSPTRSVSREHA